jgi:hypothetical protein
MTKAEAEFQRRVREFGCCICWIFRDVFSPCEIHHMLSGGRRMGEKFVLGLCYWHHRSGRNDDECVSRDHNQRRFEQRYWPEARLLEWTNDKLKVAA